MKNSLFLILSILFIVFYSCRDEFGDLGSFDLKKISDCHNNSNPDLAKLNLSILGKWFWKERICSATLLPEDEVNKKLTIEFKDSSRLIVVNNLDTTFASWFIVQENNIFKISTLPRISDLDGKLLICNNEMACTNAAMDKCNNFYTKE